MIRRLSVCVAALLLACWQGAHGQHSGRGLRGEGSHTYKVGEEIPLWASKVGPFNNPSETYEYYRLPFCEPPDGVRYKTLHHVGEVIDSNRDVSTPYALPFREDREHVSLCTRQLDAAATAAFRKAVEEDWYFRLYFDGLPLWGFVGRVERPPAAAAGAPRRHALFTHAHFDVSYNGDRVIEVNVATDPEHSTDVSEGALDAAGGGPLRVEFSYSVTWSETDTPFAARLDRYQAHQRDPTHLEIHWFSIVNSTLSVLLLTGILATILMRTLRADFLRYSLAPDDTAATAPLAGADDDEAGWKYVHADVFRFPSRPAVFCAAVGAGTQLLALAAALFALALVGVFYPHNRGLLYTAAIALYACTAGVAGYTAAALYRQMAGRLWVRNILLTCLIFAAPFFLVFCVLNTVAISYGSMAALPASTITVIIVVWALVTVPLTVVLGVAGKNSGVDFDAPCRTNKYPREVPDLPWWRATAPQMALAGFLPFSAIYVELFYIFASVWGHQAYFVWLILAIVYVILLTVTAFVAVALTYFQLAAEDHRWWWRSFLCGASTGVYVLAYSAYYYAVRSGMRGLLQGAFFFGYTAVACYGLCLLLGTVAFRASLAFVRRIYAAIKCD